MEGIGNEIETNRRILTNIQSEIILTLLYYDIFRYPLTVHEIFENSGGSIYSLSQVREGVSELLEGKIIKQYGQFFFINGTREIVQKRLKGNLKARRHMWIARWMSAIISGFPFVRAVSLSGSISKDFMGEGSDIDYFIITEPNRLWLCRTLIVLFKKIFFLNNSKWLCVNYFIDSNSFGMFNHNIFIATEIITLIPTYNYDLHLKFLAQNLWVGDFKPNFKPKGNENTVKSPLIFFKRILEYIFMGRFGDILDDFFFKLTVKFWKKKFSWLDEQEFEQALLSKKNVSKHLPRNAQKKVLTLIEEKVEKFEKDHQVLIKRNR